MESPASFIMAVIALAFSGLSVIASFVALRHYPRPFIVLRAHPQIDRGGKPRSTFDLLLINMGKASAHEVNVTLKPFGLRRREALGLFYELEASGHEEFKLSRVSGSSYPARGTFFPAGEFEDLIWVILVTWREAPAMSRIRRRTFTVSQQSGRLSAVRTVFSLKHRFRFFFDWLIWPVGALKR
ncbi:hypothetical protein I6E74_09900 [Salinibacterium sp. SWN139]|uniref:hypothetical protein n=1 Tax=Salinibacterium sp. SWN139 TaxID=2792055 RepID=UPI0018CC92ED|nr:hypothetical protein [Salinibacterium sp. SWN139]MBH0054477.1 hypothetical protein [Salinibacterium sp. SWN139]